MVNIKAIPQQETPLEFLSQYVLDNETLKNKHCIVVPTERNLRIVANSGFKYSDIYTIDNLFSIISKSEKRTLPKQLRPFFLRRAFRELNKDERLHIFRRENDTFLKNFTAFTKSSDTIFKFFRELFSEKISTKDLLSEAVYTDYENQITTLHVLWEKYLNIIHSEDFYDEWEQFISQDVLESFISEYDKYVFIISGFLNQHELELIQKIGNIRDVTLFFNYSGKKEAQHDKYIEFFANGDKTKSSLEDFPEPTFNNNNLEIYKCNSWVSQFELITKKALDYNKNHNIDFMDMAVIMPNEEVKSYFISLDKYQIYDVSAGHSVSGLKFFNIISRATDFNEYLNNDKKNKKIAETDMNPYSRIVEIQDVLDFYSSSMILRVKDVDYIQDMIKYLLKKNEILNKNIDSEDKKDMSESDQDYVRYLTEEYYESNKIYNDTDLKKLDPNFDIETSKNLLKLKDYEADNVSPIPENKRVFEEMKKQLKYNRLYFNLDYLLTQPLFKNEIRDIILAKDSITPSSAIKVFRDSLEKLFDYLPDERAEIDAAINLLAELERIYSCIKEEITFMEAANIILNEISAQSRKQEKRNLIGVSTLLESRNMRYKVLFVPGMLESNFPGSNDKDMYINTDIRRRLGLPTYKDREHLTKNYLYKIMELSDVTIMTYPITNEESRASGFIEELKINHNINTKNYEPSVLNIFKPYEKNSLINYKDNKLEVQKDEYIMSKINNLQLSSKSLQYYIDCPLRFYLTYIHNPIQNITATDEITEQVMGNVLHQALQDIGNDTNKIPTEEFINNLQDAFIKEIEKYDAYTYSDKAVFLADLIKGKIPTLVQSEQDEKTAQIYREEKINIRYKGHDFNGTIDKVREYIVDNKKQYDIIDYKYKDNDKLKYTTKKHLDEYEKRKEIEIQLPFYVFLLKEKLKEDPNFFSKTNIETQFNTAGLFSIKEDYKFNQVLSEEDYNDFIEFLDKKLEELYDKETPFTATTKYNKCKYCDYKESCERA